MKIAIVGTGIAGNVAARALHRDHEITVFEAGAHIGGHTHTHDVLDADGRRQRVDTGFIVYNERTYPAFTRLLDELGVATHPSAMSFSVRNEATGLEYNGSTIAGLFVQKRNLASPAFLGMLAEILRFNREAPRWLDDGSGGDLPLGDLLERGRYGQRFVRDYLVPMGAAIWSTDPARMMQFPGRFFVRFLHNHGMLSIDERPQWRVISGGSARYVERLVEPWRHRIRLNSPVLQVKRHAGGVIVVTHDGGHERYDHVFMACHADQALALLADATPTERVVLGALPYQRNEAVLHTDTTLLPRDRRAWAAWNYHVQHDPAAPVALTYDLNILQGLSSRQTWCVTLNRSEAIAPEHVVRRLEVSHPLFTPESVAAQARHAEISGVDGISYCGAYWRYGFHEDGVVSALQAVQRFEAIQREQRDLPRVA
jgi:predicted NAD/FAD-binding protein